MRQYLSMCLVWLVVLCGTARAEGPSHVLFCGQKIAVTSTQVECNDPKISVVDLTPLRQLKALEVLSITRGDVRSLEPLKDLQHLHHLKIEMTPAATTQALLDRGVFDDLTPLASLSHLVSLEIIHAPVRDLAPLSRIPRLQSLVLANTGVQDVSPLRALTSLRRLDLSQNPMLRDVGPLASLVALEHLDVSHSQVADIRPLEKIANLTLTIHETPAAKGADWHLLEARAVKGILHRGRTYARAKKWRDSIREYTEGLDAYPWHARLYSEQAWAYFKAGALGHAWEANVRSVSMAQDDRLRASGYYNLARIAEARGQISLARHLYQRSLLLRPGYRGVQKRFDALPSTSSISTASLDHSMCEGFRSVKGISGPLGSAPDSKALCKALGHVVTASEVAESDSALVEHVMKKHAGFDEVAVVSCWSDAPDEGGDAMARKDLELMVRQGSRWWASSLDSISMLRGIGATLTIDLKTLQVVPQGILVTQGHEDSDGVHDHLTEYTYQVISLVFFDPERLEPLWRFRLPMTSTALVELYDYHRRARGLERRLIRSEAITVEVHDDHVTLGVAPKSAPLMETLGTFGLDRVPWSCADLSAKRLSEAYHWWSSSPGMP